LLHFPHAPSSNCLTGPPLLFCYLNKTLIKGAHCNHFCPQTDHLFAHAKLCAEMLGVSWWEGAVVGLVLMRQSDGEWAQ